MKESGWKSRKLWVAILTAVVLLIAEVSGANLDVEAIVAVLLPILAFIFGQAWVDKKKAEKALVWSTAEAREQAKLVAAVMVELGWLQRRKPAEEE